MTKPGLVFKLCVYNSFYGVAGTGGENPLSDDSFDRDDPLTDSSASSELSSLYSSKWGSISSLLEMPVSGRLELHKVTTLEK